MPLSSVSSVTDLYGNVVYGFTGTQDGMTIPQRQTVDAILRNCHSDGDVFHHGDCVGADSEASSIAFDIGYQIHIHPCTIRDKRAFCTGHVVYHPLPPLIRNRVIVDKCERLIAAPKGAETIRSGTWSTVRYSRATYKHKLIHIVYSDGTLVNENES